MNRCSGLLKGDVLLPIEEVQTAYRRITVATSEEKRLERFLYGRCPERVGWIPSLANQCGEYVIVIPNKNDICWIAICCCPVIGAAGQLFENPPQLLDRQVVETIRFV